MSENDVGHHLSHDVICYCKLCYDGLEEIGFLFSKEISEEEAMLFLVHES